MSQGRNYELREHSKIWEYKAIPLVDIWCKDRMFKEADI